jgi:hypothetical protein
MDIRLLTPNPDPEAALNHRTVAIITRAFFDAHLRWGEQESWSRFATAPGKGITVEELSMPKHSVLRAAPAGPRGSEGVAAGKRA